MRRIFHALVATSVVAGAALALSGAVQMLVPAGRPRRLAEKYVLAPGTALYERLQEQKAVREAREAVRKAGGKVQESPLGRRVELFSARAVRLRHLYNVGLWTLAGFLLCLVMTFIFTIGSIRSAAALGVRVALTLACLQGAFLLGGWVLFRRLLGG